MASRSLVRGIVIAVFLAIASVTGVILFKLYERTSGGDALIGGPFNLTDQYGHQVSDLDLRGQYLLIYFGYTYCPDACPTALGVITAALDKLGEKANRVTPILITVDPARDTQDLLKEYASSFHPRLLALRGSDAQISAVAKEYRVYFGKAKGADDENYLVDHTTLIYLMGPDGKYVTHFGIEVSVDDFVAALDKLL